LSHTLLSGGHKP